MVVNAAENPLTMGIYTPVQAARLARLHTRTLERWVDGNAHGEAVIDRQMPASESGVVSFVDFVQAMAIRAIRLERRLSLQKIRETIEHAREMGISHPFARKHQTYLFADDVVIWLVEEDRLVEVTGKYKKQHLIRPIVELYLEDLGFDSTGLANRYDAMRDGDTRIVLDPEVNFGAPTVFPCRYTVGALLDAVQGEGSPEAAAVAYGVAERVVKLALRYDDVLSGTAA